MFPRIDLKSSAVELSNAMKVIMNILAVDDDLSILELLELSLMAFGHEHISTASSATEALAVVKASPVPFDCIFLDIQMPEVSGIELCRALRLLPEYRKTPIIMLTAMNEREYIDDAFLAGATDYISKPFETSDLKARLEVARRLRDELSLHDVQAETLQSTLSDLEGIQSLRIGDTFEIEDMACFLPSHQFYGYARQLDERGFHFHEVSGLRINQVDSIFGQLGVQKFVHFIEDVSEAISRNLDEYSSFTYVGHGRFLISTTVRSEPISREFDELAMHAFRSMDIPYQSHLLAEQFLTQSKVFSPANGSIPSNAAACDMVVSQLADPNFRQTVIREHSDSGIRKSSLRKAVAGILKKRVLSAIR